MQQFDPNEIVESASRAAEEWRQAADKAMHPEIPDGFVPTREVAAALGLPYTSTLRRLNAMLRAGTVERFSTRSGMAIYWRLKGSPPPS